MQESRHHIKARMLKNAARAWGYPETESENNFDPLVAMLLASCSTELEKISGEIHASRARVLERLVQLLSPDVLTGALPSHAIACALPVEPVSVLEPDAQLFVHRRLPSIAENGDAPVKEMFFSATGSFPLQRSSIRFMATGDQLYSVSHAIGKEVIAISEAGNGLPASTLWLGIDEPGISLHQSRFYFDFKNEAERSLFFHQLPEASWYLDDQLLKHVTGYGQGEISGEHLDLGAILNKECDVIGKIKKHVNAYYKNSFITLVDDDGATVRKEGRSSVPDIILDTFNGKGLQLLQKQPLRWIAIRFPETVSNRLLQDAVCIMNCFPVINSRLHDISYRLQDIINIIPLQTDDLFLDLENVSDDENMTLDVQSVGDAKDGSFALLMRNGGVGRFDERDAASVTDYILQLLRDESAAFSTLGNDFMNSEMKQLQQTINKLEQRLFSRQVNREAIPYIIIRNVDKRSWHNLFIRYWSTNGIEANNIKSGTAMQLYKGSHLDNNQAILVTTTRGGRNKLSTTETVLAYKSALLSRDRLISAEDIKAFCHYQMGNGVRHVDVQKGVMVQPGENQGFIKTVDVHIRVEKKAYQDMLDNGELSFWIDNLKVLLAEKSASLMPYRIYISEAA